MPHKLKYTQISKSAFCFFINYDRERLDVDPLTEEDQEKVWERARKHAPASTEKSICIMLSPNEVEVIRREGFKTKNRYFT